MTAARPAAFGKTRVASYLRRPPEAAARQVVRAIEHDRARMLLGPDARALDVAARLLPGRTRLIGPALDLLTG